MKYTQDVNKEEIEKIPEYIGINELDEINYINNDTKFLVYDKESGTVLVSVKSLIEELNNFYSFEKDNKNKVYLDQCMEETYKKSEDDIRELIDIISTIFEEE